jgi:hypothetical protein
MTNAVGSEWQGIRCIPSERNRSEIYVDTLPLFSTGRARLIDNPRAVLTEYSIRAAMRNKIR